MLTVLHKQSLLFHGVAIDTIKHCRDGQERSSKAVSDGFVGDDEHAIEGP